MEVKGRERRERLSPRLVVGIESEEEEV